jgi:nicotinate phosphoribosyltransferase
MPASSALLTDLYQLTMAQGYWYAGRTSEQACFYQSFRENPFDGGFTIAAGAAQVVEFCEQWHFELCDVDYLASLPAPDGSPLFDPEFLTWLGGIELEVDIDTVPEGTVVFPNEPVAVVRGPIIQCQLIESALLNLFNFESLVATKAARVCQAAGGRAVAEFGLRRAQGPEGADLASRAALIGGCSSTSNVSAGARFGLPVSGTHAHSWVLAFGDELAAFRAYAASMPNNCTLLVDTFDVIQGVKNAIVVGKEMEERGERLAAIRIDSGDLAWLARQARALLDDAGLGYVKIVASNDLDEYTINSLLKEQDAPIDAWGVGTRLATAFDQPALGGVYKLCAIQDGTSAAGDPFDDSSSQLHWRPTLKATEQVRKSTLPGLLAVRRYYDTQGKMIADMIYNTDLPEPDPHIIDPFDALRQKELDHASSHRDLLQPLLRSGSAISTLPTALEAQATARVSLAQLDQSNKRLLRPHTYPVGLSRMLAQRRDAMIKAIRHID